MATTISKRISGSLTAGNTKRLAYNGTVQTAGGDTWGGSWGGKGTSGNSWTNSWSFVTLAQAASPLESSTKRIAGTITGNTTKRVAL